MLHGSDEKQRDKIRKTKLKEIEQIEFRNVSYTYENSNTKALEGISFLIEKGEKIAIVGKNGSGKSTILKLLCGFYHDYEGTVLINGIDMKEIILEDYFKHIAALFQDYVKYEMTLLDNIVIGNVYKNSSINEINDILRENEVDFLKDEKEDYLLDQQLGNWFNGGVQLSGGQWQKIALTRAYYRSASIYILDEPSASLDIDAQIKTFNRFYKISSKSIGVFITHKLNAAKRADQIIVLDQGKLVGNGVHEELLDNCTLYRELLKKENAYE